MAFLDYAGLSRFKEKLDVEIKKNNVFYAECSTANSTQKKEVTISGITELTKGLSIRVKFANAQSYNGTPTLELNSLGAKNIRYKGDTNGVRYLWNAGEVVDFVYDGTYWVMQLAGMATTTYYGRTKLSSSVTSTSEALAATSKAVKTAYDLADGKATKVAGATSGNLAGLDANGNLTDSGKASSDFVSANQGSENNGKVLGINSSGSVTPVPFVGEDFVGATFDTSGAHGYVPAPLAGDQTKFLQAGGGWAAVPMPPTMVGASASVNGVTGLVPAPGAGTHRYFLRGDATWAEAPGGKTIVRDLDTVTNTSGSYVHTTTISDVASDMKPIIIELSNPSAFRGTVNVTPGDGSITLSCDNVVGTSTVRVTLVFLANADALTSSEFDILNNRLQAVENVCADFDITIESSDWVLQSGVYAYAWTNSLVEATSLVEVFPRDGAENAGIDNFEFEASTGTVTFHTDIQPTGDLPITIRVIRAKASSFQALSANQISTEAVSGVNNVESALTAIDGHVGNLSSLSTSVKTSAVAAINSLSEQIGTLNTNVTDLQGKTDTYSMGLTSFALKSFPALVNLRESGGSGVKGLIFVVSEAACFGYSLGTNVSASMSNGTLTITVPPSSAFGYSVIY